MAVIRAPKDKNFTVMSTHHLRDRRLSLKAIGLFSIILSLPPDWTFTIAGLATITKDGIATVRAALNELETCGYLTRRRLRSEDGRLESSEYSFYEIPCTEKPDQEKPGEDLPAEDLPA
ncbi:MAG: helix-turn-helix domain-containing protein [Faecousia sp.]